MVRAVIPDGSSKQMGSTMKPTMLIMTAAAVLLLGSGAAQAVSPAAGPTAAAYGGGSLGVTPNGYGYYSYFNSIVAFRRIADGSYMAYAVVPLQCGSRTRWLSIDGPVGADGVVDVAEIAARGLRSTGRTLGRVTMTGALASPGGSGSLRVEGAMLRQTGHRVRICRDLVTTWVVRPGDVPLTGRPARVAPAGRFFGLTSGTNGPMPLAPIMLRSNGTGDGLSNVLVDVLLMCDDQTEASYGDTIGPIRLRPDGSFRYAVNSAPSSEYGYGERVVLTGRAADGGIDGTLRVRQRYPGGTLCDTGPLTWAASP